jgi:uncharacterized RDD family membrane protein YckC
MLVICVPLVTFFYGKDYWLGAGGMIAGPADFLINWFFPAIAVILFWIYRQATPGKMAIGAKIADEKTGGKPSTVQLIGCYLGYYVSILPLMLGILWVANGDAQQDSRIRNRGHGALRVGELITHLGEVDKMLRKPGDIAIVGA